MLLDDYTYLLPGDKAPDLHIQTLEQGLIKTREAGILLVNLFIIPCLHCKRMFEFMEEKATANELFPNPFGATRRLGLLGRTSRSRLLFSIPFTFSTVIFRMVIRAFYISQDITKR